MSVKAHSLESPERDLKITTREAVTEMAAAGAAVKELATLRVRIAAARAAVPAAAPIPECRSCYQRGWMDALRTLEE